MGKRMFGALESYKDKDFYEEHKSIQFDTLTEQAEYEIVAVFKTVAYSSEGFRYYDFVDAEDEKAFDEYVSKCKEFALYDTGVTAKITVTNSLLFPPANIPHRTAGLWWCKKMIA